MTHQHATLEDTLYLYFASNAKDGDGDDGASAAAHVRLGGAAAGAAPVLSPTPTLLTHASFPAGAYEVAVAATAANGFAAGNTYGVFSTLAVDTQNPTGFIGSFSLKTIPANVKELGGVVQSLTDLKDFADDGYDPATNKVQGVVLTDTVTTYTGNTPQTGDAFARLGAPAGASVSADVAAAKTVVDAIKVKTDQLVFTIANKVDAAIVNAASFAQAAADLVWGTAARVLTAGTNIVLAKGTGVTGFNDPTVGAIADGVWDETLADHLGAGSTGNALNAAGSAGDPWSTALPGAYGAGTAGKIVGDNINATISSRSSHSAADVWAVATRTLTAFDASFKTGYALSAAGVQAIWDALTSALTTVGSIGKLLVDNINATISSRFAAASAPSNFSSLGINASGHISRVTLVDTTTTNTDMRGTDNAALAATALSTAQWTNTRAGYLDNLNSLKIKKNTAYPNFSFLMVLSSDHITPATGKTVTAQRLIDGGSFAACANSVVEDSNGVYHIDLAAADLNGDAVTLKFTNADCDQRTIVIAPQP